MVMEGEKFGPLRRGTGGDEDDVALERDRTAGISGDAQGVRTGERGDAVVEVDFVASQVFRDGVAFSGGYAALVDEEVLDGGAPADGQVNTEELAGAKAGEGQGRFAERLAGQATGVAGGAAQERLRFDDGDALAEIRGLGRALLSGGSGADDD